MRKSISSRFDPQYHRYYHTLAYLQAYKKGGRIRTHMLNKEQEKAVKHPSGPLLIAAGAGSGKTRALTSRLKELIKRGTPPHEILAITFTNKAATEMRDRVFGKGKQMKWSSRFPVREESFIGTFHSLGSRILRQEIEHFRDRTKNFSIFDNKDTLSAIKKICKQMDLESEIFKPAMLANRISKMKDELMDDDDLTNSVQDMTLGEVYRRYRKFLRKSNAFDFDDLIEKPVRLFLKDKKILQKYQNFFSHILVDEYQDINTSQYTLVTLLAKIHKNISVVGDDNQSIYKFRGSDFRNFLNFQKDWPEATIIKLEQNYRSSNNIITAASALIKHNKIQAPKELWTENPDGERIKIVAAEDPDMESVWIASEIRVIQDKDPVATIGIIYRTNAQSRAIEQALISENLPYKIYGGLKFYDRKEVKDVLSFLRFIINPSDAISLDRIQKALGKIKSRDLLEKIKELPGGMAPVELINYFLEEGGYRTYLETKFTNAYERLENVNELFLFASNFSNLDEFLEKVSLLQSNDIPSEESKAQKENPINMMTIHIAKGLEFNYVFVIGCNEGMLPHEKSMSKEDEVEEERRLMYVAMTRAMKSLYLLFHSFPSRFLYEIPEDKCEFVSPTGIFHSLPDEDEMYIE